MIEQELYRCGINFYASGKVKNGRKIESYYFKVDNITSEKIAELRKIFPYVSTGYGYSQFAPENRASILIFPTKAELKRRGVGI